MTERGQVSCDLLTLCNVTVVTRKVAAEFVCSVDEMRREVSARCRAVGDYGHWLGQAAGGLHGAVGHGVREQSHTRGKRKLP